MSAATPMGSTGGLQAQVLTPHVMRRWNYHFKQCGGQDCKSVQFGHAAVVTLGCMAACLFTGRRQRRQCGYYHQIRRCAPTDYYGLLGLPRCQGTQADLKAAYRRLVKLVHPDILGEESVALQALVTEAYNTLSDKKRRAAYDQSLSKKHCRNASATFFEEISVWDPTAPPDADAVFVDESYCVHCNNCIDIAPSTFAYHTVAGDERACVTVQYGDDATEIDWAVKSCPTGAISYVPRQDVAFLEIAMAKILNHCRQDNRGRRGPFDVFHQVKARFLDQEARLHPHAAPDALARQATAIKAAIGLIPQPVRLRAWPDAATDDQDAAFQEQQQQLEEV